MKRILPVLVVVVLLLCGCGGDSPTSTDTPVETPEATATIGPDGGTLEIDDFVMTVPAGAFSSDTDLKLFEAAEDHGFGANCVSRFFRLEGLPASFAESLTVRMGYVGTVGEGLLMAVGEMMEFSDTDLETYDDPVFEFHTATEVSGFLEAVIPGTGIVSHNRTTILPAQAGSRKNYLAALKDVEMKGTSEHFVFVYPVSLYGYVDDLAEYMEAALDTVETVGIGYERKVWKWPGQVVIRSSLAKQPVGFYMDKDRGFHVSVKSESVTDDGLPELRVRLGEAMVFAAQATPDMGALTRSNSLPWNAAVVSWLDEKFTAPGHFVRPLSFAGNESYTLQGLPVGIPELQMADYGRGWSPVLRYLTGRYGYGMIGDIYIAMQTEEADPIDELLEALPDPAYNWWPEFVGNYVTGQYYGVESSLLLSEIMSTDKFEISSASDTARIFFKNRPQLSAWLHRIKLDYPLISEDAGLILGVKGYDVNDDYLTLLVYKTKDGELEFLGSGNIVTVRDIKDLTISGHDIIAVNAVSYYDKPYNQDVLTQVWCSVTEPPPYNWASINPSHLNVHFRDNNDNEWDEDWWDSLWEGKGTWNGSTFNAIWSGRSIPGSGTSSGSLSITIDPATSDVVSFRAAVQNVLSTGWVHTDSIVGGRVLFETSGTVPNPYMSCELVGTAVCPAIPAFWRRLSHDASGTWSEIVSYSCTGDAGLRVSFWYAEGE
ncbi:MAG: hypothetical protein ABIJ00_09745 [Candidatus Eisenbacteria bacterium]